jgi:hypothetical protein
MNVDKHIKKAKRLESSLKKLDAEDDWESIVEICYGISLNYIAIICERKLNKHSDTHKGLPRFLDENELNILSTWFRELDILRQGRWYGGKHNGDTAKTAISIINKLKVEAEKLI